MDWNGIVKRERKVNSSPLFILIIRILNIRRVPLFSFILSFRFTINLLLGIGHEMPFKTHHLLLIILIIGVFDLPSIDSISDSAHFNHSNHSIDSSFYHRHRRKRGRSSREGEEEKTEFIRTSWTDEEYQKLYKKVRTYSEFIVDLMYTRMVLSAPKWNKWN